MKRSTPVLFVLATALAAGGCQDKKKTEDKPEKATSSASPVKGCGADFTDPAKELCLTLPTGFTAAPDPNPPKELYSELINFSGPNNVTFSITVGFTSSNWKTYDDQVKSDADFIKGMKVDASGKTTGTGQWWTYDNRGYKSVTAVVKSNGDKAIRCNSTDAESAPVVAACKSIRAYPK